MARISGKQNKNIYHLSREKAGLSREEAAELLGCSDDRIERIENRGAVPHPDEIIAMAYHYKDPILCNSYCANECAIGRRYTPEIKLREVSQITLEMLSSLIRLTRDRDRLIEIMSDGEIRPDETADFGTILKTLDSLSITIDTLRLWTRNEIHKGRINATDIGIDP